MCVYVQELKDCLARFAEGDQAFSAWNVTQAVRSVVGFDTNVSHDEVKGMVHILMEGHPGFNHQFNGKFVEYVPIDLVPEDAEPPTLSEAEEIIKQTRLHVKAGPEGSFVDRDVLLFPGEAVKLRFDRPVSVVEIRAG